jgi:hypothetical protein
MTDTTITSDNSTGHTTEVGATIDGYLACWNTTDAGERTELIERFWTTDARMVDPLVDVTGPAELAAVFTRFHEIYPGCSFRRVGDHDAHHQLVRWGWEMIDGSGNRVLAGLDVALLADDGRLQYVAGFFG